VGLAKQIMPIRKKPLITEEVYHVVNRSFSGQPIFVSVRDYGRAQELINYYRNDNLLHRYSQFLKFSKEIQTGLFKEYKNKKDYLVEIIAYCLMPTHFHFLLKQVKDEGIVRFVANFSNGYAKYFNIKNGKRGPVFEGRFKTVAIRTDEQLVHVSRYIHLNPHTSSKIETLSGLEDYPYSSFREYLGETKENICDKELVLGQFKSKEQYKKFVFDNADYQRELDKIKRLTLE